MLKFSNQFIATELLWIRAGMYTVEASIKGMLYHRGDSFFAAQDRGYVFVLANDHIIAHLKSHIRLFQGFCNRQILSTDTGEEYLCSILQILTPCKCMFSFRRLLMAGVASLVQALPVGEVRAEFEKMEALKDKDYGKSRMKYD